MFDSFWFVPWCMLCYCVGAFIGVRFLRQIDLSPSPSPFQQKAPGSPGPL